MGTLLLLLAGSPVVAMGVWLAVRQWKRVPQSCMLEIDARELRLLDPQTSARLFACPLADVRVEPRTVVTEVDFAALDSRFSDAPPMTIVVPDARFQWRAECPQPSGTRYCVGSVDWLALVDRLGERAVLEVQG